MRAGRYTAAAPDPILTKPSESIGNAGNSLDWLRHPRSDAYSATAAPHRPAGCILGAGVAGVVFLYTHLRWWS